MKLFGKTLGAFDILKVCGYVSGIGGIVTPDVVEQLGVKSPTTATHVAHLVGAVVVGATLVANTIRGAIANGSVVAVIPKGTMPVVADANGTGTMNVQKIATAPEEVTSAARAQPPKPGAASSELASVLLESKKDNP